MANDILKQIWPEWEIEGNPLGKGSFGVVYKAVRSDFNVKSYSAVKVISIPTDPSEIDSLRSEGLDVTATRTYLQSIVNDFVNEIQLMESLKGTQNIVNVEDYQVVEKTDGIGWDIYIRMELLTPFNSYICDKKLAEPDVIKLGCDICSALEICGQRNIIHRDIKPENIFVNDFGFFKLGDFGIARKLENMTGGLSQKGTFNYMAPEVAKSNDYDSRVDIYSLGVVLYRLLNGNRLPFLDNDKQLLNPNERRAAIDRRLRGEPLPAPCDASPAMAEVILRACAYDPNARFASAVEMKQALTSVANGTYQMTNAFSAYGEPVSETPPKKTTAKYSDKTVALFGESNRQRVPARNSKDMAVGMAEKKYKFTKRVRAIMLALGIVCVILAFVVFVLPNIINRAGNLPAESGGNISDEQTSGLNVTSSSTAVSSSTSKLTESLPEYGSMGSVTIQGKEYSIATTTQLKLADCNLTDADVVEIGKLVNLTSIDLHSNQISDITPLKNLTNLTEAYLYYNQISDISPLSNLTNLQLLWLLDDPVSDLTPIANLSNLTELWLDTTDVSDLTPLSNLSKLTSLNLGSCEINDITPLAQLTNLKELWLTNNGITDITPLASLTNLTSLWLEDNQINDLSPIANLTNLTGLALADNQIDDVTPLKNLTKLTSLSLQSNKLSDISPLSSLTGLTGLGLRDNRISDITPLANLTNLEELHLNGNKISDLTPLANLTKLTTLSVYNNQIDYDDVAALREKLPNCNIIITAD